MSIFDKLVRLWLPLVPRFLVGRVASRYVAGESLAQAVDVVRQLNRQGAMATLDFLGEEAQREAQAEAAVQEYLQVLQTIKSQNLDCNISVKPTLFGLRLDPQLCLHHLQRVVARAAELGVFVRLDMEDHSATDHTLAFYRELQQRHGNTGVVLQSMLRRTVPNIMDLRQWSERGCSLNVRLCKGIYREPPQVAWQDYDIVRQNFRAALQALLEGGAYVGVATHDEYLVWAASTLVQTMGLSQTQYEFQMLLGVAPGLRQMLLDQGHRLRVYVPYGHDWYGYSMRRMRENPSLAKHVLRALFKPG